MTPLQQALADYLGIRRLLGFELEQTEAVLEKYLTFMERAGASQITTELAVMFAKLPIDADRRWWRQRLGIVRTFARYAATIDPSSGGRHAFCVSAVVRLTVTPVSGNV
jgi:integrase/recombinase XerD